LHVIGSSDSTKLSAVVDPIQCTEGWPSIGLAIICVHQFEADPLPQSVGVQLSKKRFCDFRRSWLSANEPFPINTFQRTPFHNGIIRTADTHIDSDA